MTETNNAFTLTTEENIRDLAMTIADVLADTPANHTRVIDIRDISTLADFFVISSGENERQLRAISRQLTESIASRQIHPSRTEGDAASGWILIDYADVVVHVFSDDLRAFYNLEELWQDAPIVLDIQ